PGEEPTGAGPATLVVRSRAVRVSGASATVAVLAAVASPAQLSPEAIRPSSQQASASVSPRGYEPASVEVWLPRMVYVTPGAAGGSVTTSAGLSSPQSMSTGKARPNCVGAVMVTWPTATSVSAVPSTIWWLPRSPSGNACSW